MHLTSNLVPHLFDCSGKRRLTSNNTTLVGIASLPNDEIINQSCIGDIPEGQSCNIIQGIITIVSISDI